jgi:hypothetical protein
LESPDKDVKSCGRKRRDRGGEKQSELEERTVVQRRSGLREKKKTMYGVSGRTEEECPG